MEESEEDENEQIDESEDVNKDKNDQWKPQ